ncbi:MAG: hypothetical protein NUV47_03830 [Patescibacteria group bacterium]|nr:hypothetical protein [Patescibacteria group bacterium]
MLSPKSAKKKRVKLIAKISFVIFIVIIIIGSFSYSLRSPILRIQNIEVVGNNGVVSKDIINFVKDQIIGNYFFLFPKDNSLLYPNAFLKNSILSSFIKLDNVDIHLKNLNTLEISVSERKPYVLWCAGELLSTEECYFMDKKGLIFSKAPAFSGNVFVQYYGKKYYQDDQFEQLDSFIKSIQKLDIQATAVFAKEDGDFEVTSTTGKIIFNNKKSYDDILENLMIIMKEKKNINYVDLRYGNKVYFKTQ